MIVAHYVVPEPQTVRFENGENPANCDGHRCNGLSVSLCVLLGYGAHQFECNGQNLDESELVDRELCRFPV